MIPKVALITVLYNSDDQLAGFFKSLSNQTYKDYHLYILDNTPSATTDDCLSRLKDLYPISSFEHIKSNKNLGFAKANNIAIKIALEKGYEYFLITNNDIEFDQDYLLKSMVETADKFGESLIVPKIYFHNTNKIWLAGGNFIWWKAMGEHIGERKIDNPNYDIQGYYNYSPLCIMLIKANLFKIVGLLDEDYFVYYEDTDFMYRAVKNGFRILYLPQLKVMHKVGSSTGSYDSLFSIYYGNRNRIFFIKKHYGFLKRLIAYSFVLSSRVIKYINYNALQRTELLRAIKDGFAMTAK